MCRWIDLVDHRMSGWCDWCVGRDISLQCWRQALLCHAIGVRIRTGHQHLHFVDREWDLGTGSNRVLDQLSCGDRWSDHCF